ncbi:MAG TPA: ATP synthase F1 subunit epsilon [Gemmatimonadaceae bacterium]|nr:ATP synthase F1 subunit epsilon [Gemmatimonadaceae bacterium]
MLTVSVISPERILFEGTVDSLVAPAFDGEVGILPRHATMMTLLGKGELRLGDGGSAGRFQIEGGFLQVLNDSVRVVTERAVEGAESRADGRH